MLIIAFVLINKKNRSVYTPAFFIFNSEPLINLFINV